MSKIYFAALALAVLPLSASADDWTGAPLSPPTVSGNPEYPPFSANPSQGSSVELNIVCAPNAGNIFTNPPCGPNTQPLYNNLTANPNGTLSTTPGSVTILSSVPAGVTGASSQVSISASGAYIDPSAPSGVSIFSGNILLSDFARNNSVATGFADVQAQLATLDAEIHNTSAILQQVDIALRAQQRLTNSGIAQALAMAGTTDLQPDENYAISMNVGTFGGQSAFAASGVVRINEHAAFNAGFTSQSQGGPFGARAGFRIGW